MDVDEQHTTKKVGRGKKKSESSLGVMTLRCPRQGCATDLLVTRCETGFARANRIDPSWGRAWYGIEATTWVADCHACNLHFASTSGFATLIDAVTGWRP